MFFVHICMHIYTPNFVECYSCGIYGGDVLGSLDYSLEDACGTTAKHWVEYFTQALNSIDRILEFDYTGAGAVPAYKFSIS